MELNDLLDEFVSLGRLVIDPSKTDEEIGKLVRAAMDASHGMPFTIVQSLGSIVFNDVKEIGKQNFVIVDFDSEDYKAIRLRNHSSDMAEIGEKISGLYKNAYEASTRNTWNPVEGFSDDPDAWMSRLIIGSGLVYVDAELYEMAKRLAIEVVIPHQTGIRDLVDIWRKESRLIDFADDIARAYLPAGR